MLLIHQLVVSYVARRDDASSSLVASRRLLKDGEYTHTHREREGGGG